MARTRLSFARNRNRLASGSNPVRIASCGLASARVGFGVVGMLAPRLLARGWVGDDTAAGPAKALARALGGRDLALGLGAVLAISHQAPARGWMEAGGLADAGDVAATLACWRVLPRRGRWAVVALAGASLIASGILGRMVDRAPAS
ncbi:MAG: hypothetical protein ACRDY2_11395 [Acidimicrobiales bacterium]